MTVAHNSSATLPNRWLAFELSVLRRLRFSSIALPFSGEPDLGVNLKRWKVRVAANDPLLWAFTKATALVENRSQTLSQNEIESILEDDYVPRVKLDNPSLLKWFNETDACWFENLHFKARKLELPQKRAIALTLGMMVGDYVLSFDNDTRQLREPLSLSRVFLQMSHLLPFPYDNSLHNLSTNQNARDFVAERQHTDLLFLRLPVFTIQSEPQRNTLLAWREEWVRGGDDFWDDFERQQAGQLGSQVQSKQQYLGFVEDLLRTAAHIPSWAIAHTENGFISGEELLETVSRIRKVEAIYTKDFSDLLGVRASIMTAGN
jgi:hypothetical protein